VQFPNQVSSETIHHIFIFLGMGQAPPHFVVKVVTEVDGRKCDWQHSMARLRKSPYRRKNLAYILYTDRVKALFVQNFVAMATSENAICMQHSMAHPRKPPYKRKNLADIFYKSRVIVNFVPNFVAMATGVGQGKCSWQHSMAHPRRPPIGAKISQKSPTQADL